MRDESGVETTTLLTPGFIEPTGESGGDGAYERSDEIAHETTPGLGTSTGTKDDDVGGDCSRTNNDGELGGEIGIDERVTRGSDDTHG